MTNLQSSVDPAFSMFLEERRKEEKARADRARILRATNKNRGKRTTGVGRIDRAKTDAIDARRSEMNVNQTSGTAAQRAATADRRAPEHHVVTDASGNQTSVLGPRPESVQAPSSQDYDHGTAVLADILGAGPMYDKNSGHHGSRVPVTPLTRGAGIDGRILKSSDHPTFNLTEQGEAEQGNRFYSRKDGNLHSGDSRYTPRIVGPPSPKVVEPLEAPHSDMGPPTAEDQVNEIMRMMEENPGGVPNPNRNMMFSNMPSDRDNLFTPEVVLDESLAGPLRDALLASPTAGIDLYPDVLSDFVGHQLDLGSSGARGIGDRLNHITGDVLDLIDLTPQVQVRDLPETKELRNRLAADRAQTDASIKAMPDVVDQFYEEFGYVPSAELLLTYVTGGF